MVKMLYASLSTFKERDGVGLGHTIPTKNTKKLTANGTPNP
jgi:hypothetical protein